MLVGETYNPADEELTKLHRDMLVLLKEYNDVAFVKPAEHTRFLHRILPNASRTLVIQPPFLCDFGFNIYMAVRFSTRLPSVSAGMFWSVLT